MPPDPNTPASENSLLQACALLFLFRALARTRDEGQRIIWEEQIVRLIGKLVPCTGGAVILGPPGDDEIPEDCVALPLDVRGEPGGLLAVWFGPEELDNLARHREVLSAVATLAGAALDNIRDLIAAIAAHHGLTIVSRDRIHFDRAGVPVLNPWETT